MIRSCPAENADGSKLVEYQIVAGFKAVVKPFFVLLKKFLPSPPEHGPSFEKKDIRIQISRGSKQLLRTGRNTSENVLEQGCANIFMLSVTLRTKGQYGIVTGLFLARNVVLE